MGCITHSLQMQASMMVELQPMFFDLAAANLSLKATSIGLSVHQMIGILPDNVRVVCQIPEHFEAWTALAIGYKAAPA